MQSEVTIILPMTGHGKIDQSDIVNGLIHQIVTITGGASVLDQTGYELWEDGALYFDVSKRVVTIVDDANKIAKLRNVALDAIDLLHQRGGIFFQVIGGGEVHVEFLDRDDVYSAVAF